MDEQDPQAVEGESGATHRPRNGPLYPKHLKGGIVVVKIRRNVAGRQPRHRSADPTRFRVGRIPISCPRRLLVTDLGQAPNGLSRVNRWMSTVSRASGGPHFESMAGARESWVRRPFRPPPPRARGRPTRGRPAERGRVPRLLGDGRRPVHPGHRTLTGVARLRAQGGRPRIVLLGVYHVKYLIIIKLNFNYFDDSPGSPVPDPGPDSEGRAAPACGSRGWSGSPRHPRPSPGERRACLH